MRTVHHRGLGRFHTMRANFGTAGTRYRLPRAFSTRFSSSPGRVFSTPRLHTRRFVACLLLAASLLWGSCTKEPRPWIHANPEWLPAGPGWGTTAITWSTEDGSLGQVYLWQPGRSEMLFAEGASGYQEAPWIVSGSTQEFRLYSGKDHKTMLASVTVEREKFGQGRWRFPPYAPEPSPIGE